jgi:hypothetical protein
MTSRRSMPYPLPPGQRIRISELGAARCPGLADRRGTVVGGSRYTSTVRVILEGNKSPIPLHRDYIELLAEPEAAADQGGLHLKTP